MADDAPTKITPDPVVEKAWKEVAHLSGASDDIRENRAAAKILAAKGSEAYAEGNDTAWQILAHAKNHLEAHQQALLKDQTTGLLDREKAAIEREKRSQPEPTR
jgi:hypothetical protein